MKRNITELGYRKSNIYGSYNASVFLSYYRHYTDLFAAIQPWIWSFYSLLMIAAFVLYKWLKQEHIAFLTPKSSYIPAALFFSYTTLFWLPLPSGIISVLSPVRFESISTAQKLTDIVFEGQTLSYSSLNAFAWWVFLLSLCLFFFVVRYLIVPAENSL